MHIIIYRFLNAWLARPRHITPKSVFFMFMAIISASECFRTDENESLLHAGVRMGTVRRLGLGFGLGIDRVFLETSPVAGFEPLGLGLGLGLGLAYCVAEANEKGEERSSEPLR